MAELFIKILSQYTPDFYKNTEFFKKIYPAVPGRALPASAFREEASVQQALVIQVVMLVYCLAGELDSELFENLDIYIGEHD